jgi:hypothetical protein
VLAKGQNSGMSLPKYLVIKNPSQWQTLWRVHSGRPGLSPPAVDFSKSMIIAVFMGEKHTGGYSVDIKGIKQADKRMWVDVSLHAPAKDKMVTMALTQPFIMVSVPRFEGEVMFRFEPGQQ